jgi:excinuclease UvrABC nuclease subunit
MIAIDILREEMEKAHGDLTVWQEDWIVKAMERYAQQQVKTHTTPDEGRREEYHCELYEFGRCESPCAKQCESCFWMESKR